MTFGWYFLFFFIMFHAAFSFSAGGINIRSVYAYKVSDGVWSFFKNYALSYLLTHKQINTRQQFYPEVNAKLEKLLATALVGGTNVGWSGSSWRDETDDYKLRIVPLDSNNTLPFQYNIGNINDVEYLLSPTFFILANKVVKMLHDKDKKDKIERQRRVI